MCCNTVLSQETRRGGYVHTMQVQVQDSQQDDIFRRKIKCKKCMVWPSGSPTFFGGLWPFKILFICEPSSQVMARVWTECEQFNQRRIFLSQTVLWQDFQRPKRWRYPVFHKKNGKIRKNQLKNCFFCLTVVGPSFFSWGPLRGPDPRVGNHRSSPPVFNQYI